jgi:hypothetical protein
LRWNHARASLFQLGLCPTNDISSNILANLTACSLGEEMMSPRKFIVFLTVLMNISCASITRYEPVSENDSLIIGKMEFICSNFNTYGSATVNGENIEGIEIMVHDLTNGKHLSAFTRANGLFVLQNLNPSHQYQIIGLYLKKTEGNSWASATLRQVAPDTFSPLVGKVYCIGSHRGTLDNSSGKGSIIRSNEDVIILFKKYYKKSKWVSFEFVAQETNNVDK